MAPSRITPICFLVYLCFCGVLVKSVFGAKARHFKWEVEYMFGAPDCLEHVVMGINGQFPGPTIKARAGDTVVVHLTNKLHTEGVVIHWHGIRQLGTPWADGTASISQCAINPGETFVYRFKVDKAGTYFYHGHYGMQRSAGLYGLLIVDVEEGKKELFQYDGEFNLLLSDWWHKGVHDQEVDLSANPMRWIGEPQSLLINGRGQYNCSLAAAHNSKDNGVPGCRFRGNEQCAPNILHVKPNKTYRLRVASTTALASLNLAIGCTSSILINGSPTAEFRVRRGLRQGDPLSPFLFIIAMEGLHHLMETAKRKGLVKGIETGLEKVNISHLFYADDAIFINRWSLEEGKNIIRILRCFYMASGLKLNLEKSDVLGVGVDSESILWAANELNCKAGKLPCKYLGVPLGDC